MTNFKITFDVSGSVTQKIKIVNFDYTPEMIVQGLQNGTLYTSISSGSPEIVDGKFHCIAKIESTVVHEDTEYGNYEQE